MSNRGPSAPRFRSESSRSPTRVCYSLKLALLFELKFKLMNWFQWRRMFWWEFLNAGTTTIAQTRAVRAICGPSPSRKQPATPKIWPSSSTWVTKRIRRQTAMLPTPHMFSSNEDNRLNSKTFNWLTSVASICAHISRVSQLSNRLLHYFS